MDGDRARSRRPRRTWTRSAMDSAANRTVDAAVDGRLLEPPQRAGVRLSAAVALFARTLPKTATALFISSIVPNEMRQCDVSNGGKSRATRAPLALHAPPNALARRPLATNLKRLRRARASLP